MSILSTKSIRRIAKETGQRPSQIKQKARHWKGAVPTRYRRSGIRLLGQDLGTLLERHSLTISELSRAVGCNRTTLGLYVKGATSPQPRYYRALCAYFEPLEAAWKARLPGARKK